MWTVTTSVVNPFRGSSIVGTVRTNVKMSSKIDDFLDIKLFVQSRTSNTKLRIDLSRGRRSYRLSISLPTENLSLIIKPPLIQTHR